MKVRIEIDTKTFVRFWLVVIGFGFGILALYSARTALTIIGIALFLALALNGPVSKLASRLPDRSRTLSTAIAFFAVISFLAAVIFLVVPPIVQQTSKVIDSAPTMVTSLSAQWHVVGELLDKYHIQQPNIEQVVQSVQTNAAGWTSNLGSNLITGLSSAIGLFTATILVLVLTFLMLVEGPMWLGRVWRLYTDPDRMQAHQKTIGRMHAVVSGYVTGQLAVSGIDAFCAGFTVFLLSLTFPSVPANLALPTVAILFVLSLIPLFGATLGGAIVSILLLLNSLPAAIIFAVYFMLYQQVENNYISPTIQSRRIELSPLAVLVAVTIGLYVFGIAGGIISIPIAGCVKVLVEEYLAKARQERKAHEKPLHKIVSKLTKDE